MRVSQCTCVWGRVRLPSLRRERVSSLVHHRRPKWTRPAPPQTMGGLAERAEDVQAAWEVRGGWRGTGRIRKFRDRVSAASRTQTSPPRSSNRAKDRFVGDGVWRTKSATKGNNKGTSQITIRVSTTSFFLDAVLNTPLGHPLS